MLSLTCPGCRRTLNIKNELAGKKVRCPGCKQVLAVKPAVAAVSAAGPTDTLAIAEQIDALCDRFEDALRRGERPDIRNWLPADGPARLQALVELGRIEREYLKAAAVAGPDDAGARKNGPSGTVSSHDAGQATLGESPRPAGPDRELTDFLSPPQAPGELGWLGGYRILQVLGRGGMGVVFRAEDPKLQRQLALKAMLPTLAASGTARERFLREARLAASVEHDHVVVIHQVGEDRGVPFLVMPLLRGESLDERLKREGNLPVGEALRIGREAALGLAAAHKRGLVHRDIKPANLWLEEETGRVKVLDFGLARAAKTETQLTQTGAVIGTPAYMAPEQANGEAVDARTDLFSLGCVLYRMTTGELPFQGKDALSTLMAVVHANPAAPSTVNLEVSPALSDFILRLLSKDPVGRPASAEETAEKLAALRTDWAAPGGTVLMAAPIAKPVEAPPSFPALPAAPVYQRPPKRYWPWKWIGAAVAASLLIGGGVLAEIIIHIKGPDGKETKAGINGSTGPGGVQQPIDLLRLIDTNRDAVSGRWRFEDGILVGGGDTAVTPWNEILQVPYAPPEEYDLTASVERTRVVAERAEGDASHAFTLILASTHHFQVVLDWQQGPGMAVNGFQIGADQTPNANSTTTIHDLFRKKGGVQIVCHVRRGSVFVFADELELLRWTEDTSRLGLNSAFWGVPDKNRLAVGL